MVKSALNKRTVRQMLEVPNPASYETKFSLLYSQEPTTGLYPAYTFLSYSFQNNILSWNIKLFQMACYTQILRLRSVSIHRQLPSLLNMPPTSNPQIIILIMCAEVYKS